MNTPSNSRRKLANWLWQSDELSALQAELPGSAEMNHLDEATSCLEVAWRVLGGLEPVPAKNRAAVAWPLLEAGLRKCLLVAGARTGEVESFETVEWQNRLATLSEAERAGVLGALRDPTSVPSLETTRAALFTLRVALERAALPRRRVRTLRLRRGLLLSGATAAVVGLLLGGSFWLTRERAPDLATGKTWTTSSTSSGFPPDGVKAAHPVNGLFFSTDEEDDAWWQLDLGAVKQLRSVQLENRSDCCSERAPPLVVELSVDRKKWVEVGERRDNFSSWTASFTRRAARYVRVRTLRKTYLHLRDVQVRGAE